GETIFDLGLVSRLGIVQFLQRLICNVEGPDDLVIYFLDGPRSAQFLECLEDRIEEAVILGYFVRHVRGTERLPSRRESGRIALRAGSRCLVLRRHKLVQESSWRHDRDSLKGSQYQ